MSISKLLIKRCKLMPTVTVCVHKHALRTILCTQKSVHKLNLPSPGLHLEAFIFIIFRFVLFCIIHYMQKFLQLFVPFEGQH